MRMEAYAGENFETAIAAEVETVARGVGKMTCPECKGDPENYAKLFPPELGIPGCIDCKGRGWVYVSV